MKKNSSILILLVLSVTAFSQQIKPIKKPLSINDYRSKSNDQLVLGSLLLGLGTALMLLSANQNEATLDNLLGRAEVRAIGVVIAGGSIPLFISAIHNHKKSKSILASIKFENSASLQQFNVACHSFPAVSLKIK